MNVIGANVLSDYGAQHPKALPALRALHALIVEASWTGRDDVQRECGAISSFVHDGLLDLDLSDCSCRVAISIHYEFRVVRILTVTAL
jgi:mRNA-degrading endonuclease HigB of HigAB toxin-antitoxin module